MAHPTDSKLLETARSKLVQAAQDAGIELKQTIAKEGRLLRFKAGRYAHANQFTQLRFTLLTVTSSQRDLHPQVRAHAGRRKKWPQKRP